MSEENTNEEVQEVTLDDIKEEDDADPAEGADTEEPKDDDTLEVLGVKNEPVTWEFGEDDYKRTYTQKKLSFYNQLRWGSLVGDVLDRTLSSGEASIDQILGTTTIGDLRQADSFVAMIGKLSQQAPSFMLDSWVIWLNVPEGDEGWVREVLKEEIDNTTALELIEIFVDQNIEAIDSFFRNDLPKTVKRVQARLQKSPSASSKRSKSTRPTIRRK